MDLQRNIIGKNNLEIMMFVINPLQVYLAHKPGSCAVADIPDCLEAKPGISSIHGNTFIFDNGDFAEVDDFIYCTGMRSLESSNSTGTC